MPVDRGPGLDAPLPSSLAAFDAERFRARGHEVVELLAAHLERMRRGEGRPMPAASPSELCERWPVPAGAGARRSFEKILAATLADSTYMHHPRYMGHQVSSPMPEAALCELVSALLNNGMAAFEAGPAASVVEARVVRWMADAIGYGAGADGVLTSGGSIGNLTALLAARQAKARYDAWDGGATAGPPLALLVSDQAHYCVARAARILGWGAGGIELVPTDGRFRMRADELDGALERSRASGRRVIAVVASACSTATGSIDPLEAIADFCARHDLWMHVDGAHAASALLSRRHKGQLGGMARADSVVWDAHKLLMMPALVTGVLFRDGRRSYDTFAQQASYLFPSSSVDVARAGAAGAEPAGFGDRWYDRALRTIECTKKMMGLPLYVALETHGDAAFEAHVDRTFELAARLASTIAAAPDFELLVEPETNIVCFRFVGAAAARVSVASPDEAALRDLDDLQDRVRAQLLHQGDAYVVRTELRGRVWLRTALMSSLATAADLEAVLDAVRSAAADVHPPG